ncbi:MAG: paraquat-inducible protein A [Thiogranum sp.]|nr:paraquat-inducible protein A [Thiogranum sp.]
MNIARTFPAETRRLRILLLLTACLLGVGMIAPVITLKKFVLIENTFSVLGGVVALLREGQLFLFVIITGFSLVLPVLKIAVLTRLLSGSRRHAQRLDRYLHWMHLYGKWSMLDVFVVAVLVVAVKLGAIASVEMRAGLYAFAAAVLLTMYVTARIVNLADRLEHGAGERSLSGQ